MTLNRTHRVLQASAMLSSALILSGCSSHQLVSSTQTPSTPISITIESSAHTPIEVISILESGGKDDSTTFTKSQSAGPQLIAGDWLAWQCAIAGNYFDTNELNNAPASMFASSPTDSE